MIRLGGLDVARFRDFSAFVMGEVEESDKASILRVRAVKIWPHVDYSIIETDICSYANRHELLQLGVDATNEVSFSERLRSLGLPVKPVRFTMSLKQELVSDVMLFLSQKRLSIPSRGAEELLAQMREQERIISQAGSIRYEHPSGRHDDVFWAFAIMVHLAKPYMLGTLDFRIYPIHR